MSRHVAPVLFVVPSLRRAGAETQVVELINRLNPERMQKHLVSFQPELDLLDEVDAQQVTFHHLQRRGKFDLTLVRRLARLIDEYQIELVHCTLQFSMLLARMAIRLARRTPRVVVAIHTTLNRSSKEELFDKYLYASMALRCDQIVFVCEAQSRYWCQRFPAMAERSQVIYNGIDTDRFAPKALAANSDGLRQQLGIDDAKVVLACIAGFRPEKGHRYLLEALARLADTHLVLAGDGLMRAEIEAQIALNQLGERVHLLGQINDVRPVLHAADTTVLASTAVETFSMAMLESMASATPVVATDIGGLGEAIEPERNGALVVPGDVEALARGLNAVAASRAQAARLGACARECVLERFSVKQMVDETERMLSTILASGANATPSRVA